MDSTFSLSTLLSSVMGELKEYECSKSIRLLEIPDLSFFLVSLPLGVFNFSNERTRDDRFSCWCYFNLRSAAGVDGGLFLVLSAGVTVVLAFEEWRNKFEILDLIFGSWIVI